MSEKMDSPQNGRVVESNSTLENDDDDEGIQLLKEIFPDFSIGELKTLHTERVRLGVRQEEQHRTLGPSESDQASCPPMFESKMSPKSCHQEIERLEIVLQSELASNLLRKSCCRLPKDAGSAVNRNGNKPLHRDNIDVVQAVDVPRNFLRIPANWAVPITNDITGQMEWKMLKRFEDQVVTAIDQVETSATSSSRSKPSADSPVPSYSAFDPYAPCFIKEVDDSYENITVVLRRDENIGLGMTIHEVGDKVRVLALIRHSGTNIHGIVDDTAGSRVQYSGLEGPAERAGIRPRDQVLGINGRAFILDRSEEGEARRVRGEMTTESKQLLKNVVEALIAAPDPIILHVRRFSTDADAELKHEAFHPNKSSSLFPSSQTPVEQATEPWVPDVKKEKQKAKSSALRLKRNSLRKEEDIIREHLMPIDLLDITNDTIRGQNADNDDVKDKHTLSLVKPKIHPFAKALQLKGLLHTESGKLNVLDQTHSTFEG